MYKLLARVPITLAVALGLLVAVAVSVISLDSADRTEATSPAGCLGPGASASIIAVRDVDGDGLIDFTVDTPVPAGAALTPDEQILFRVRFGNTGFSTCDVTDVQVWASIPGSKDNGANVWVKVCEATIIISCGSDPKILTAVRYTAGWGLKNPASSTDIMASKSNLMRFFARCSRYQGSPLERPTRR